MIKIKVPYTIFKEKELTLTTREYCNYHASFTELKKLLAYENNVNIDDISIDKLEIIQGNLDYDNLDK